MRLPSIPGPGDVRALADRAADLVDQLLTAAPRLTALLDAAEELLVEVAALVGRMEATRAIAGEFAEQVDQTRARADQILSAVEGPVIQLLPALRRLADTTTPREVEAVVGLVDNLPKLLTRLEEDVLPILDGLSSVAPDLRDLLDASRELNEMLGNLPGMGRIKKRVEEQQETEQETGQPG